MLFILDKSHQVVGTLNSNGDLSRITTYFDDKYIQDLGTGAETFQFSTLADNKQAQHLVAGNFVAFKEDGDFKLFNIIQIEESHEETFIKTVYCEMAGIELINEIIRPMKILNSSLRKFLTAILEGTEWQLGKLDAGFTQVFDFESTDYKSAYELIQEYAVGIYGAEISYRVEIEHGRIVGKYIDCYKQRGKSDGFRFAYGSNLTSVTRTVDMSNLATALIGVGKSGITFKEVDTGDKPYGQDFVVNEDAFKQWNINGSHIFGVHKEETESPQELLRLTRNALIERSNPQIKYEMKVELLGREVKIGDTVNVVDHEFNPPLYLSARVNQLTKSKTNPYDDEVVLANFKELRSNITEEMRALASQLEGYVDSQFPIGSSQIQNGAIGKEQFSKQYHTEIVADAVYASLVETEELIAGKANIGDLTAVNAQIENLTAENARIENLVAENADITNAKIEILQAEKATVEDLVATNAYVSSLQANKADIVELNAVKGNIALLESEVAEIGQLKSDVADIEHILAGNITADNIQTGAITAGSGIIADGAIGNAQISSVDAGKVSAGTVDTSKVTIQGANGHLRIKGNRLQVFNGTGSQAKERVSVGDVNGDGTVYGLRVRGADGTTVLLDENGVTKEGITDGSITNDKISDNAEIDGAKLNINSVVSKLNEDGTEVIKGTKIEVDGTSLTTKLSTITNKQTEQGEKITQNSASIQANENAIKLKVDNQTYQTDKTDMTSKLNKNTSEISTMKGQIALKVEQSDIETANSALKSEIQTELNEVHDRIDGILDDVGGAISDGIIEESETIMINSSITQLNKEKETLTQRYNYIYNLSTLTSTMKSQLKSAMDNYTTKQSNLISHIQSMIVDKHISDSERTTYDTRLNEYSTALASVNKKIEECIDSISSSKIDTAKAEIKVTTDGISQSVSNLSTTVSKKADSSTVTNINNKVTSLDTTVSGISGKVTNVEKTVTNLGNDIIGVEGEVETLKSDVASLEVTTSGISQKVSSVESTTTTLTSRVNGVQNTANTANTNATSALNKANTAQSTADSKAKVFTSTPTVPYQVGDLWVQGTSGDVMRCKTARTSGSYTASDWAKASKYTDDTKANAVDSKVTTLTATVNTTNSKVAELTTNLDSITQRVSSTESKVTTHTTQLGTVDSRINSATTNAINNAVGVKDTRNDNQPPSWYFTNYPKRTVEEFKYANKIGIGSSSVYGVLTTVVPWGDSSGGYPTQTFRSNSTSTYERKGTSATAWGAWTQIESTSGSQAKATQALNDAKAYTTTQITTTNNKVASIETNLNGITSRVSNVETKQTTANNNIASLTTRMSSAESKITSSAIINTVSSTIDSKVNTGINNIQVGGRNFVTNSNKFNAGNGANGISATVGSDGVLAITASSDNGNWYTGWGRNNNTHIENNFNEGDKVTISFTMKSPNGTKIPSVYFKNGMGYYAMSGKISANYSTVYCTTTWKKANSLSFHLGFQNAIGTYYIKDWKIEKGNKATDWTPAPEDVSSEITSKINTAKSEIKQTTDSIQSTVTNINNNYASKSQLTQTVNDFEYKFQQSKANLLYNSSGRSSKLNPWWHFGYTNGYGSTSSVVNNEWTGYESGFCIRQYTAHSNTDLGIAQTVSVTPHRPHTLIVYVAGHRCGINVGVTNAGNNAWVVRGADLGACHGGTNLSNWHKVTLHFTPTESQVHVRITMTNSAGGDAYLWMKRAMLVEGKVNNIEWSPNPSESMNNVTNISRDGIIVSHDDGSYSLMNGYGFQWFNGNTGNRYHHLMTMGEYECYSEETKRIWLPTEFRGKPFKVITSIKRVSTTYDLFSYKAPLLSFYAQCSAYNHSEGWIDIYASVRGWNYNNNMGSNRGQIIGDQGEDNYLVKPVVAYWVIV